ncbi:MAG: HD domain-containing protein [Acholeplasmatales bacterium]|nr:HD domain-containing protein [Acholeplasmatales bacterium]
MKKTFYFLISIIIVFIVMFFICPTDSYAIMGDKTEIPVNLEVSGAEALCQTDDGYVWIAQYSGLVRYDSKSFKNYKSFTYNNEEHIILNVRALANKHNTLYIATSSEVLILENEQFQIIDYDFGTVRDIIFDDLNDLLYISSSTGAYIFNVITNNVELIEDTKNQDILDIAVDKKRNNFYYQNELGIIDKNGNEILLYPKVLDLYSYGDILYIGEDTGVIKRYDMKENEFLDDITVSDQINKLLYSDETKILYVACEKKGLFYVDLQNEEPVISLVNGLENNSQLIDLMIDYEGNIWIASHYIGASGVSIITQNAILELLYDDPIWQSLNNPPAFDRNVYAVERYDDILYIISSSYIYLYDVNTKKILPDNILMDTINDYANTKTLEGRANGDENYTFTYAPKDVEKFNGKIYFAVYNIGIVEYDPINDLVNIFDKDYMESHKGSLIGNPNLELINTPRALRAFDNYLAIGYSKGLIKYENDKFNVMNIGSNVLFINKSKDGKLIFDRTRGLFVVDDAFTTATEIPTEKNVTGNRLKFLVDGDYIYYNLNSRLYRLEEKNGVYTSKEITVPYIKGSIVELSKIQYKKKNGDIEYKYVIGSQTQIYIADTLDGDILTDYEFYDSTNGLQPIIANTSGYYDEEEQLYFFQSTNGIFVYDFNEKREINIPIKMTVSEINLDDNTYYGNSISVNKNVYRVAFDLSILGFKPNKGYKIYYKLDGVDVDYHETDGENRSIYYTNLAGGTYKFHVYAVDEYGQSSNEVTIDLVKEKKMHEEVWFWVIVALLSLGLIALILFIIIHSKTKQSLKKQLEYKNITLESIQAIARTIDAKDEYTNGHSIRVGYYSKLIAENLGLKPDEVDNIYYIALLHDIGKIAIPDNILNKPGRLTDDEFKSMKSHTTKGAKILNGISTIPQIIDGAKSHHERYDGTGYPEGLKGEEIPLVARIICCADCIDAMASKRVYKEPYSVEKIISEFRRCSGTQFDPKIASLVIDMMEKGILKPYSADNTYLGDDGRTHRMKKEEA